MPIVVRALNLMSQHGSSVEMRAIYTEALSKAVKYNSSEVVKLLLDSGIQFERKGLSNAFYVACDSGHTRAVLWLTENDTSNLFGLQDYNKGLEVAAMKGHSEVALCLIQCCPEQSHLTISEKAFIAASGHGSADIVRLLVERVMGSELRHSRLNRALNIAVHNGHTEVAEFLIEVGGDVNAIVEEVSAPQRGGPFPMNEGRWQSNSLQAAIRDFPSGWFDFHHPGWRRYRREADATAHEATIHLLLENGANVNELAGCPTYPLYVAAAYCSERIVQSIINKGAVLDESTSKDETALKAAAGREVGAASIVKVLLQAGAAIPESDAGRNPVLNSALAFFGGGESRSRYYGHDGSFLRSNSVNDVLDDGPGAVVKLLLPCLPMEKADNEQYCLLLQMAVVVGDCKCVEMLIQRQVDVNARGYYYGSALQAAARVGNVELVQLLLSVGADVNLLQGKHDTALRAAVLGAHKEVVDILIKHCADVNLRFSEEDKDHENSRSVLHLSLETRNVDIVKSLIAAGADVNVDLLNHPRVLTAACGSGDFTIVQLLLDSGADVNALGKKRRRYEHIVSYEASALHRASKEGHESVARILLECGADTEREVETSGTPLQVAAGAGHVALVRVLLEAGANVDRNSFHGTALSIASYNGHLGVVQELLRGGAEIADPPRVPNALAAACKHRHLLLIERLLDKLCGTDKEESACADALSAATASPDDELFQLLSQHMVSRSPSMLRQACAGGLVGSAMMLLESGVDINSDDAEGSPALHIAAGHQRPHIVQLLLDHGADVCLQSTKYGSPLLAALEGCTTPKLRSWARGEPAQSLAGALPFSHSLLIYYGYSSRPSYKGFTECELVVRKLVDYGADVNTEPRSFGNALHLASFMGSEVIVRLLLNEGADVNSTGGYFETALLAALEGGHLGIVELLLRRGVNVNHYSSQHGTALHCACLKGSKATVRILLKHGADVNVIHGQHGSPLAAAASRGFASLNLGEEHLDIVQLLLRHEDKLQIREHDLVAAAKSRSSWREIYLKLFLKHDKTVRATESLIVFAIKNLFNHKVVQLLLERDGGLGTTEAMLRAATSLETMNGLLKHRPVCRVTPHILAAAGEKGYEGRKLIQLLLDHEPDIPITETVMIAVLELGKMSDSIDNLFELLFERSNELEVSDAMLKAAKSSNDMMILLKHAPDMRVTQDVLTVTVSKGSELVSLLLKHDKNVKIPTAFLSKWDMEIGPTASFMTTVLEHDPDLHITAEVLSKIVAGYRRTDERQRMAELLLRYEKKVDFNDEVRTAIDQGLSRYSQKHLKALFYKLERKESDST